MGKDLFKELEDFLNLTFIESVEWHNWILGYHIAESDER